MAGELGDFSDLLRSAGIDPSKVRVLRHVIDKGSVFDVWRDDRRRFEAYQSLQLKSSAGSFNQRIWAACIGLQDGRTVFVGLYRANEPKPVPEGYEEALGRFPPSSETHDWYDCQPMSELSEYSGRLLVEWIGRNWNQLGKTARQIELLGQAVQDDSPSVTAGRNPPWTRDELILALDLYMTNPKSPPGKTSKPVRELSDLLNRLGARTGSTNGETFRNPAGVYMKTMNFRRFDPEVIASGKVGLTRGNKDEEIVWDLFAAHPERLRAVADAIRAQVLFGEEILSDPDEETYLMEAPEGRILTRVHRTRERDPKLVRDRKKKALNETGKLVCEVCDFDFAERYGSLGEGFIEVHHTKPVHTLPEGGKTKLDDLALVCSNCHRMIHSSKDWLSIEQLREVIRGFG